MMMEKKSLEDLAVFGGLPAFTEKLYVGRPNIGDRARLLERINDILDRRWFTNHGPYEQEFEQRIAEKVGVKYCVAMCNATIATEIAIRALDLWGEVILPSFTFIATAHALQWQRITPVFADIEPQTHTLDPQRVEELITPRTTGIIGVHLWGHTCNVEMLAEIAGRRGLRLLFDAAHAFGVTHGGRMIGNFGDAEIFSFHATKFLNSFEGGAVVTNDDKLAAKMRLMRNFGFAGYDRVVYLGTNGKMTEVCAVMGLTSLDAIDELIEINQQKYKRYDEMLCELPGVELLGYDEKEKCNYQYIVLLIDEAICGLSRDELLQILWAENVIARRYFYPGCHRMEPYKSYYPQARLMLPVTEKIAGRVLCLPTGAGVGEEEIDTICGLIRTAMFQSREVHQRLAKSEPVLTI